VKLTTHLHLVLRLRMSGTVCLLVQYVSMANVKLSLRLTKYHAMKTNWRGGGMRAYPKVSGLTHNEI
jgi:hypothetical protein